MGMLRSVGLGHKIDDSEPSDIWLLAVLLPLPVYALFVTLDQFYPEVAEAFFWTPLAMGVAGILSVLFDSHQVIEYLRQEDATKTKRYFVSVVAVLSISPFLVIVFFLIP